MARYRTKDLSWDKGFSQELRWRKRSVRIGDVWKRVRSVGQETPGSRSVLFINKLKSSTDAKGFVDRLYCDWRKSSVIKNWHWIRLLSSTIHVSPAIGSKQFMSFVREMLELQYFNTAIKKQNNCKPFIV